MRPDTDRFPTSPWVFLPLWMRHAALLCGALLLTPGSASAERSIELGYSAGCRWFGSNVGLNEALFVSMRLGVRTGSRFTLWTDLTHGQPEGTYSGARSFVTGLRALGQFDLKTDGVVRPYLVGGAGALYFNFGDRTDTAFGMVTGGGGLGFKVGTKVALFVEGTVDVFWADETRYDSFGAPVYEEQRYSETSPTAVAGISLDF